MKRPLLFFFCILSISVYSQPYGNEWIDHDQKYLKFDITTEGIYRIDYTALSSAISAAGSSISSIDPRNLQIFTKGVEQYIYVQGEGDGVFNTTDFIELYATINGGAFDAQLFDDPASQQLHQYESIINDTAVYFITWNDLISNRRMENMTNELTGAPPVQKYCNFESRYMWGSPYGSGNYFAGVSYSDVYSSKFDIAEGFTSYPYAMSTYPITIETPHIYTGTAFEPTLKMALITTNTADHHVQIDFNDENYKDTTLYIFKLLRYTFTLDNLLSTNTLTLKSLGGSTDLQRYSFATIHYPRQYDFDNHSRTEFNLPSSTAASRYLEVTNFDEKSTAPILYDLTAHKRMIAVVEADISKFHLDFTTAGDSVYITSQDVTDINNITAIETEHFIDFSDPANQGNYVIISNPALYDDGTGMNWVEEYRNYRSSFAGGSYNAKVIDIAQLYEQFSYGIRSHPLAIRNFALYATDHFTEKPDYLFLMGKSVTYDFVRGASSEASVFLLPTFGYPGSDIMLTCRPGTVKPEIPLGRLTTTSPLDIKNYYDKVVEYEAAQADPVETIENKAWMKNVLHFAGGSDEYEQNLFNTYLINFGHLITDTLYGANLQQFNKTTTDPILYSTSVYADSLINAGVSLMTFFGHAAASSLDYNVGFPDDFVNAGKYHVVFSNGCNTAAIHGPGITLTEQYVFAEHRAAVAFIASSTLSIASYLYLYGMTLYDELANKNYGKGLGDIIKATDDSLGASTDVYMQMVIMHTTLQGDPALRLNTHEQPDYAIEAPYVYFDPPYLSTATDSFTMHIVVTNLGRAVDTAYFAEVRRHKPDGTVETFLNRYDAPAFRDTISITYFTDPISGIGLNTFDIHIDNAEEIAELDELNNYLTATAYIISNDAIPVYPYDYAIVNHVPPYLAASTADVFATEKQFVMQIDTTINFNSPLMAQTHIVESGGIIKWNSPPVSWLDSVVYYWRVSLDSIYDNALVWKNRSFIYKPGIETGWNQSHYFQYLPDDYSSIVLNPDRKFYFNEEFNNYQMVTGVEREWWETASYKNGVEIALASCAANGFLMYVIDYFTGESLKSYDIGDVNMGPYGDVYCSSAPFKIYQQFNTDNTTDRQSLYNFMMSTISDSSTILMYSNGDPHFYDWDTDEASGFNLMDAFAAYGATAILPLTDIAEERSLIFKAKKGDPSSAEEIVGLPYELITATYDVSSFGGSGSVTTPLAGPAASWDRIKWKWSTWDSLPTDINTITLIGVSESGLETELATGLSSGDTTIAWVNALEYPYVKLKLNSFDDSLRTPAQIDYLRVIFQPVPEAALNPNVAYSISADSVDQGAMIDLTIATTNISELDMDSMLIEFSVVDHANVKHMIPYERQDSLLIGENMISHINFSTATLSGYNTIFIEVNPDNDQPEQYHFNNLGFIPLYVKPDIADPLLDVTFDGVHILDGDLVSAKPEITIQLRDENHFLALDDTSYLTVQLKHNGLITDMSYDGVTMKFYPADSTNLAHGNNARVELTPGLLEDGIYQLIVHGEDVKGNNAGNMIDYTISFEVINKPMISNVMNYPNPFTTQTRFVFTLTGSEVPQYFKIQIMTVTGKVIREIMSSELGDIHIGNNITEFAWDGTDKYGDALANGLYLFRVVTKLNGASIDKYDTGTDKYFNNGWGKMYLVR